MDAMDKRVALPHPRFGHTPLSAAFRFIEPTWRNYIQYVDLAARAGDAAAARYLSVWKSLPKKERDTHLPEQICELAAVSPSDLISWVSAQAFLEGSARSSLCLSFMRDRVLEKTAEFAMASVDNHKHADLFLKAAGALPSAPSRSGPSVAFFNVPVSSSGSVALAGSKSESSPVDRSGLRDMDQEIVDLSRIMQSENADSGLHTLDDSDDDEDDDDDEDMDEDADDQYS